MGRGDSGEAKMAEAVIFGVRVCVASATSDAPTIEESAAPGSSLATAIDVSSPSTSHPSPANGASTHNFSFEATTSSAATPSETPPAIRSINREVEMVAAALSLNVGGTLPTGEALISQGETPEHRLGPYISSPNDATLDRTDRVYDHGLYLVERRLFEDMLSFSEVDEDVLADQSVREKFREMHESKISSAKDAAQAGASRSPESSNSPRSATSPDSPEGIPEEHHEMYISSPCDTTRDRICRVFEHKLRLVEKTLNGDPPTSGTFHVLGATGSVYEVKLQQRPHCTCPDFPRSKLCKHMLFVMLRVLKLNRTDPRIWQRALLTSEVKDILSASEVDENDLADESLWQRFREIQESKQSAAEQAAEDAASAEKQKRRCGDCPKCFEQLVGGTRKAIETYILCGFCRKHEAFVICTSCGTNLHKVCFERWIQSQDSTGRRTMCIDCRSLWEEESDEEESVDVSDSELDNNGYINLAHLSEAHKDRDSTLRELYPLTHKYIGRRKRRRRWDWAEDWDSD